jgi:hypothetical protein
MSTPAHARPRARHHRARSAALATLGLGLALLALAGALTVARTAASADPGGDGMYSAPTAAPARHLTPHHGYGSETPSTPAPSTSASTSASPSTPPAQLPVTGPAAVMYAGAALLLMIAGAGLYRWGRRRAT